jgi:hypothetical protein
MTLEHRLDDTQLSTFLRDGLLLLQPPELDAQYHAHCFDAAHALYDQTRKLASPTAHLQVLGDNLLAQVPALHALLSAPSVTGALASVLGDGYVLHPHHFVHSAGRSDQGFHQDGNLPWNTRGHFRSPRPIAAILFYYPQAVTDVMGPTEVLPGTQYWRGAFEHGALWHGDDRLDRGFDAEASRHPDLALRDALLAASLDVLGREGIERRRVCVPEGTVALLHYDLVHRGTRLAPEFNGRRYMYKFYFLRTQEPRRATWNNTSAVPVGAPHDAAHEAIVARSWRWLRGERESAPREASDLSTMAELLRSDDEGTRRAAGYALGDAGDAALDTLCTAARDADVRARRMAAFALGELRTREARGLRTIVDALADEDSFVRSNAAFSLGSLARVVRLPKHAIGALLTRLDAAVEPDNTTSAGLSRSTVRECVAQALLMAACNDGLDDEDAKVLATLGLADGSRYVRGLTVQALLRFRGRDAPEWQRRLLDHLEGVQYQALSAGSPPLTR